MAGTVTRPQVLAEVNTYDSDRCRGGYAVEVRNDGTMRITKVGFWQGDTSGNVWITAPVPEILDLAQREPDPDEPDIETAVCNWLEEHPDWQDDARQIRRGATIR